MTWLVFLAFLLAVFAIWPFWRESMRRPMNTAARATAPGDFVTLSRGVTHYQWRGAKSGPIAVCVHGQTTPSYVWNGIVPMLGRMGYRVLSYDLYGRGYSDRPKDLQDHAFFVEQLKDLLASQGVEEKITLFGFSMGGAISTDFASKYPSRIRKLVLLAPAGLQRPKVSPLLRWVLKPGIGDWLMLLIYPAQHRKGTELERNLQTSVPGIVDLQQQELKYQGFTPGVLSTLRAGIITPLETEHRVIADHKIPVLLILGETDDLIPPQAASPLAEWHPQARIEVVPGAGHGLPYTHTDQIMEVLTDFLE